VQFIAQRAVKKPTNILILNEFVAMIDEMKHYTWYTSDHHFGHFNIIEYCNRPYANVQDMNDDLVARFNSVVKPDDSVMILGDLCMGKVTESLEYVKLLNGHKTLLVGNHDKPFGTTGDKQKRCEQMYFDAGIDEILYGSVTTSVGKHLVTLCHFPRSGDSKYDDRYAEYRPTRGGVLLHGHTHGKWRVKDGQIDVGVDSWSGTPVSEETLANLITAGNLDLNRLSWTSYDEYQ